MEISKNLQEEIVAVQNKLQNAILEHQIYVGRLKDDPNNADILGQIQTIQVHIVSLGRCQKQVVQRLRKEVEAFKADNANGSKVSVPSFLGLNNNNHITNNNETKHETAANGFETKPSKEDYEEIVRNGDVHHSLPQNCAKNRPSSVETISGEDDVVEVSMDENSCEKQEAQEEHNAQPAEKQNFLYAIGLITQSKCIELQNKRVERKRRSTANPQFVYSMLEQPSKRKRHSYLQSGNAPHTRQTTARMNGPSPPPPSKAQPTKSISPPVQAITKSLIPLQKSTTTRPNILRNADSKVFANKSKMEENQMRSSSISSAKSIQSIGNKVVHIPGLPSSLTIERIGNDSVVCICCRNPGSLTICKNCSSSYHISCHSRSPAPFRTCPKCALAVGMEGEDIDKDDEAVVKGGQAEGENKLARYKKDEKLAATSFASGVIGKARQDPEVCKTAGGLHKIDTTQKKCVLSNAYGINQLPASTFLIPITSNGSSVSSQPESSKFTSIVDVEQRQDVPRNSHVVFNQQHSRSGVAYVHQTEDQMPYSYQLPGTSIQPEKHQSYLIVKKIAESAGKSDQSAGGEVEDKSQPAIFNYQLSADNSPVDGSLQSLVSHSLFFNNRNNYKKQSNRAVPALHRVTAVPKLSNALVPFSNDYQLDRATLNGRKPWAKLTRGKLCINQTVRRATETLWSFYENEQQRPKSAGSIEETTIATASLSNRSKHRSRAGTFIHSLLPGHNKSYTIAGGTRESRGLGPNDGDCPLLRQQLCGTELLEQQPERQQSDKPATVQLQRRALTRFFEHVKLEEAHISAPLGTKLAHKDDKIDDGEIARQQSTACDQRYDDDGAVAQAPLLTACHSEKDRLMGLPWVTHDARDSHDDDNSSNQSSVQHTADMALLTHPDDFESYELARDAHSPCMVTYRQLEENDRSDALSSDAYCAKERGKDDATMATLRIAQSDLSELCNEVSVPDDKAETERQDLPSGRRSRSNSSSSDRSNSSNSSTNSTSSGHSDTPEQAMNNASGFSNDFAIFSSKESEDELRRHELAMSCEADCSDAATG